MANKIRIKQIDLQGVISASVQVDLLSASNYIQFVTQLDTTMSSDAELAAVSGSISQSIYTINQVIGSGLVSGSSQLTSSYDTRYILSGSITQTTWDNISGKPAGLVSESTDLSSLNQFTSSIQTQVDGISAQTSSYLTSSGSVDYSDITNIPIGIVSQSTDLTHLNSFTSSYYTDSSSFDTRIGTEKGRIDAILSASSADKDSFAEIVSLINSVDLTNDNAFATFYTSSNARINSLENATGSYLTSLNGALSSSSQLTGSFDERYTISGSVQPLPSGLVSGSSQLTSSYDTRYTLSGSVGATPSGTISGSSQLTASYDTRYALSSSLSSISSSFNSRFNGLVTTGSNTFSGSQVFSGSMTVTSGQVIASTITNNSSSLYLTSGSNLYVQNNGVVEITGSIILNGTTYTSLTGSGTIPSGTVSGSSQLTSSYDSRYVLSGSVSAVPAGTISGSSQLTASFDTRYLNTDGDGVISGSSQLTSSFDTRYALSGSGGATIPAGTVSGSSQLTSSYDGRYTLTSSFNSFTASAQAVTTGSNSFNGTQIITGSLIITTGSFVGSQILANTSSLYLTSGSNMYVQNNGVVEITGSLKVSGSTRFETVGGDEGGEIEFGVPTTNTTLSTRVVTDVYRDRFRIFDGNGKGVHIDLSKAPSAATGELLWKATNIVNAGTFVSCDNLEASVTTTSNRGLSLRTWAGTIDGYISGHYQGIAGSSAGTSSTTSLTTSASTSIFSWNFTNQGDMSHYILRDDTNNRVYRIILIIGSLYNNNFISIERLY